MSQFRGDLTWVHLKEAHEGKPYHPGEESGVTLDPGVDLGYADPDLVKRLYRSLMSPDQWEAVEAVMGKRGAAAVAALNATPNLGSIRISREQADELVPYAARPYLNGISRRFTPLTEPETLPSVQTVLLSLAYNRGANNPGLDPLRTPLEAGEWGGGGRYHRVHAAGPQTQRHPDTQAGGNGPDPG